MRRSHARPTRSIARPSILAASVTEPRIEINAGGDAPLPQRTGAGWSTGVEHSRPRVARTYATPETRRRSTGRSTTDHGGKRYGPGEERGRRRERSNAR